MKVFKFGGASLANNERIENLVQLLRSYREDKILIVISAIGKTTNALEKVAEAFYANNQELALSLFEGIKNKHITLIKYLLVRSYNKALENLLNFFTEVEWILHDKPVRSFNYYYDQIVCTGELLSSFIVSVYLNEAGLTNQWLDVRDILRTNNTFKEAVIDWDFTTRMTGETVIPALNDNNFVITQGFIGATDENESTTLGREGSDYSAAIFANILNAENITIWKDVEGILNADPKKFPDAVLIPELNYTEVIEMAYYGAQVIHPKTIKPLQNKGIPLYVKCFLDPSLPGTIIHKKNIKGLPPIRVVKEKQVLMQLNAKDFSFVGEQAVGQLYHLFEEIKIKPNLSQNGAISFVCCMDDEPDRIEKLAIAASDFFDVQLEKGLTLLTIRHYNEELLQKMVEGKRVILKQQTAETVQVLMGS